MLRRLREGAIEADRTLAVLRQVLPPDIATQVWGAVLKDGTLTVLVRSAAWGTRLRYLAPEFADKVAAALGTRIDRVKVKVRAGRG
jgi:predicted nucleic acid-binding Zn ribbon protein